MQFFRIRRAAIHVRAGVTSEFDSASAPILDLIPRQRKETRQAICQVVPKFPASFQWISRNEQSGRDSHFVSHCSKVQEIVRVTVIEREGHRGNAHFARAYEFNGLGKAYDPVMLLQKKDSPQEHFRWHSHSMRAI